MSGKPNITLSLPFVRSRWTGSCGGFRRVGFKLVEHHCRLRRSCRLKPLSWPIDDKGTVFVRYSEQKQWPSTSAVNPSLVKTILEQKEGFTEAEGPDGVRRLFGFTTLHHSSKSGALFVSVGIPTEVAFANSQRIFYDSLVVLLVAALLAVAGTWLGTHLLIGRRLEK